MKNPALYMSNDRYIVALKHMRHLIANGEPLVAEDSDVTGDKWTHCSWGMCSMDAKSWPDPQDHLWPDQFIKDGRVAPKYAGPNQKCPMDKRDEPDERMGCFYRCRIFRQLKSHGIDKDSAVQLYDGQIAKAEAV
jgi:hypothetical protein